MHKEKAEEMSFKIPHNSNSRNTPNLLDVRMKHGMAGYGIYFCLIEMLAEVEKHSLKRDYAKIAFDLRVDVEIVRSVVEDFSLFILSRSQFESEELNNELRSVEEARKRRSEAGRKGGLAKAKYANSNAN